jgi:hypothetical protein
LVPAGVSARHVLTWIARRERYGASGRGGSFAHRVAKLRTHCRRGHLFTDASVDLSHNARTGRTERTCKICRRQRQAGKRRTRPEYVWGVSISAHDDFYLRTYDRLRGRLVAAHPDKGRRSSAEFVRAQRAWMKFETREKSWYAQYGLEPPRRKEVAA